MARRLELIPVDVIHAAISGDEEAIAAVVAHYHSYIYALSLRQIRDIHGNVCMIVDEAVRLRLEAKLIYSILTCFETKAS